MHTASENNSEFRHEVGLRVAQARMAKGLSQRKLALILEMDRVTLNHIEAGTANPTLGTLERIADGLDVPVASFFAD